MLADLWKLGDIPALNAVFYRDGSYKEVDFKTVNNELLAKLPARGGKATILVRCDRFSLQ